MLGEKSTERVLAGKAYDKGMRAHKITFQAMWQLLMPQFIQFLAVHNRSEELKQKIIKTDHADTDDDLVALFTTAAFQEVVKSFEEKKIPNPNYALWFTYLHMVSALLLLTGADREGIWDLHLSSFKKMLPFFYHFGYNNYAKYCRVFYAEM